MNVPSKVMDKIHCMPRAIRPHVLYAVSEYLESSAYSDDMMPAEAISEFEMMRGELDKIMRRRRWAAEYRRRKKEEKSAIQNQAHPEVQAQSEVQAKPEVLAKPEIHVQPEISDNSKVDKLSQPCETDEEQPPVDIEPADKPKFAMNRRQRRELERKQRREAERRRHSHLKPLIESMRGRD